MEKKNNNCTQHVRLSVDDWKMFSRLYPKCLSRFIQNCVRHANLDKFFFEREYFLTFSEVENE